MIKETPVVNIFLKDLPATRKKMDLSSLVEAVTQQHEKCHVHVTDIKWAEDHLVACFNIVGHN